MKDPALRSACVSKRTSSQQCMRISRQTSRYASALGGGSHLTLRLPAMFLLACLLLVAPAFGTRKVPNYPKILAFTGNITQLPESAQDSLSWSDVLVCLDRPETIAAMRARNPNLRFLWNISPQFSAPPPGDNPWWIADTLWSPGRLGQYYVQKNDWYMRTTSGELLTNGTGYLVNWTRFCPLGTYGSAKGLRASEWYASVLLPQIALSGRFWDPWSWDSKTSYNGYLFEIMADCLGSYGWQYYANADPDRDGDPDGVYHTCSGGGANDPLSVLMRQENEVFYARLSAAFPSDFVFVINENNKFIGPWWRTRMSGMKLENWMGVTNPDWMDWWDWFYGLTPPWTPRDNWGSGYAWVEALFNKSAPDSIRGWDLSFIQVWDTDGRVPSENLRQMRWGLGTSMLGDGYFCYTKDQWRPHWQRQFDWDFGTPLGPYLRESVAGNDTLFVRLFSRGMVEVNPYRKSIRGVSWLDSRFTFWLPVEDLAASVAGVSGIRATWTIPNGVENDADYFELRYSTAPITLQNFESATSFAGNPVRGLPGARAAVEVKNLNPGITYYLAVRTHTAGRPEPLISSVVSVRTPSRSLGGREAAGSEDDDSGDLPDRTALTVIAPNPARWGASIGFAIAPQSGPVSLTIHDVSGRLVRTLVDGLAQPGRHTRTWDGLDARGARSAAGVYFVRMSWPGGDDSGTMLILK
jgi:hypothetical protein